MTLCNISRRVECNYSSFPWTTFHVASLVSYLLKQRDRHLKVSLNIGGWSWSANFSTVAVHPQKCATSAKSALEHVRNLGLDGIGK